MWVSFNALFSWKQEINYLLCFEYEGKVIDASKERRFFFFFEVQRTDWRRFLNLLTDFCRDDDFQQPKGSRQGDQHPSSHPFSWLLLGPTEPLPAKGAERGSLTHTGLNKTSTQWGAPSSPVSDTSFFEEILRSSKQSLSATTMGKAATRSSSLQNRWQTPSSETVVMGTSLAVQWLRLHLPMQRMQVQSLVRELRSHMPHSQKLKI